MLVPPVLGGLDPIVLSRQLSKLLEKVSVPSVPLEVLESQQKTCEDLTDRLVEAGATVVALEAELKQKDKEIAALKERLQASEQKMQREEAKNAWLNEGGRWQGGSVVWKRARGRFDGNAPKGI
ncbi:hypothetical protein R1flu_027888 [Riccia fluitans]|uniref:Uncharacterized protein n=1 Tax=Riccia fluitans TaxID=41844 RepID=A0ABD1XK82_9MARC